MNTQFSRRYLLILSTTSLTAALLPSAGLADPDERPVKRRKPGSKKKTKSPNVREEIKELKDEQDDCLRNERRAKYNIAEIDKENAALQKRIDKELAKQIKLSQDIKDAKLAERNFKTELRRGKNAAGGDLTDKQRAAVVRKTTRVIENRKGDEEAVRRSKAGVRNMRKRQNELRRQKKNMQGLSARSIGECKTIARKLRALNS